MSLGQDETDDHYLAQDGNLNKSLGSGDIDHGSAEQHPTISQQRNSPTVSGWQLKIIIFALCFGLLLSTLETTIIATALVNISASFGKSHLASWIVVAYLLTYTGFLIIYARLSDFFGRRNAILVALAFFILWSLACGFAQRMEQLIIFRALQGIGGSGIYSMVMVTIPEITPPLHFGLVSGLISAVFASSSIIGPIMGGAITSHSSWRWVFWLNVPCGAVIVALTLWKYPTKTGASAYSKSALAQVDLPGVILSLAGSIMLVFALEQGGVKYPWDSGIIVASFVVAGISWVLFGSWETFLTSSFVKMTMRPIFPTRLLTQRVVATALLSGFLTGFPFMVTIINLPQWFQIVNGLSPVDAGVRMLPLLLVSACGAGIAGAIASKKNVSWHILVSSNALQVLGLGLMSSLPSTEAVSKDQYGFQAILGMGFGLGLSSLIIVTRVEVDDDDLAVAMGAITQVRVLGGVIGLAIAQAILTRSLDSKLGSFLSSQQITALLDSTGSISDFSPAQAKSTRQVYGDAFNLQMRIVTFIAAASVVSSLFAFRRHPVSLKDRAREQRERMMGAEAQEVEMEHEQGHRLGGEDARPTGECGSGETEDSDQTKRK
ncbi:hypothetical protein IMSHALPRED_008372 [Imshaugia aleurites]|uniref:Major facilitator superfamily (MFS) profile domain-containing protein n=1 Tax=Imshaugia aleurites TaxID=172621 RepID=A0A8H3EV60_9LECA|nr:hypothetical protein IMSHALPRED_008372 [Imshaugia aleurites]